MVNSGYTYAFSKISLTKRVKMSSQNNNIKGKWIGKPNSIMYDWRCPTLSAPIFRKTFDLISDFNCAKALISGLGFYELYINAKKVEDYVLAPSFTVYDKRWRYNIFDVASYLHTGKNVICVMLGNGLYNCQSKDVWHFDKATWRDYPKMIFQLDIDGDIKVISDTSWSVSGGPILFDSLRGGEVYDARQEDDWNKMQDPDAFCDEWSNALVVSGPGGVSEEESFPPCRVVETIPMSMLKETMIYEAPYNLSGWARIVVSGSSGSKVTLYYSERINEECDQINTDVIDKFILDGTFQKDEYILCGKGIETWEPRFTYHGFQYVYVEINGEAKVHNIDARVINTDFVRHGEISSSDERIRILDKMAVRSILSNSVHIPTDCPHREKNGWTSEAQLMLETALYTFDAGDFYAGFVDCISDVQRISGQLPGMTPTSGWGYNWGSGPAWDSALFTIPYQLYLFNGDLTSIKRHYLHMKKYIEYCQTMANNNILFLGLGDWLAPEKDNIVPAALVSTAYYYYSVKILSECAGLLGFKDDNEYYLSLSAEIKKSFNDNFYLGGGYYKSKRTTALAISLVFNLADEQEMPKISQRLKEIVVMRKGKVDYGTLGSKLVLRALLENQCTDEAFMIMTQPEYPGYLYWKNKFNATTFYENWDGSDSRNHSAFVDIIACMYKFFGGFGFDINKPGPRHIIIKPQTPRLLKDFEARFYGYRSSWNRTNNTYTYRIDVPENCTALFVFPDNSELLLNSGSHSLSHMYLMMTE